MNVHAFRFYARRRVGHVRLALVLEERRYRWPRAQKRRFQRIR